MDIEALIEWIRDNRDWAKNQSYAAGSVASIEYWEGRADALYTVLRKIADLQREAR